MTDPIHLSDAALEALKIAPAEITDALERAILAQAAGRIWAAPKAALQPGDGRYTMATLSTGDAPHLTVVKSVTSNPANAARGLPVINGGILVLDSETGLLKATMEAGWVTAVRTAAISAAAARKLANPAARRIAFIGTGVQARIHLDTFAAEFPLEEAVIVGRGRANIDRLAGQARAMGMTATEAHNPEAAVGGADIVVTSVTLDQTMPPFLDGAWLAPGAFAAIVDLSVPWKIDTLASVGTLAIDDHAQEAQAVPPLVPKGAAHFDLGELVAGPHRFNPSKSSAFAFRGMAIGDFAAAAAILQRLQTG